VLGSGVYSVDKTVRRFVCFIYFCRCILVSWSSVMCFALFGKIILFFSHCFINVFAFHNTKN
jgi:hypothetical protein